MSIGILNKVKSSLVVANFQSTIRLYRYLSFKLHLTKVPTNKQCFDAMISRNAKQATLAAIAGLVSFGMLLYILDGTNYRSNFFKQRRI